MAGPVVAVFCMPEHGHFRLLRALIFDLVRAGFIVHVFTHARYCAEVERAGARAVDLFARFPLEQADDESIPFPCRYVAFAAAHVEELLEELRSLRPALVVYETFAVIGRVAARLLGIPYVNVSPGHYVHPARSLPALRVDPRVAISERCHRAVEVLRGRYGLGDASPFSYIDGLSPYLNLCCQPSVFLTEEQRRSFEPAAFYGCIPVPPEQGGHAPAVERAFPGARPGGLRIYACFGTVVFRYFAEAALSVFEAVSETLAGLPEAQALLSLGGAAVAEERLRRLRRPNVTVVDYDDQWAAADQWAALGEADLFLTHHGLNSTHEAIMRGVPMLSYPFFSDQPALAERCRQFGLAVPLTESLRGPVDAAAFRTGVETLAGRRDAVMASLERARSWELEVMAERPAVIRRIMDLASATQGAA